MEKALLSDFSLGLWDHDHTDMLQPRASAGLLSEGYVDESGIVRCRGKVAQRVAAALTNPGSFVFAGQFRPGFRELYLDYDAASKLGVARILDAAGTAVALAEGGHTTGATSYTVVGNVLYIGSNDSVISGTTTMSALAYAGSRKATVSLTNVQMTAGSKTVTRAAGGFIANVDVGMIMGGGAFACYVVTQIVSDTVLTIDRPHPNTVLFANAAFQNVAQPADVTTALGGNYRFGSIAGRLLILKGNRLVFSDGPDPVTGDPRTGSFPSTNLHEFPVDADGIAVQTVRDRVFVLTQTGIYIVSGMAYEIVDPSGNPQHPIELLSSQLVALGQKGIVSWGNAIIVPCRDGIYAIDGIGAPVTISRGIPFAEMVRDGLELGWATVYKGRYILPYIYGGQYHTWVFRLDGKDSEQGLMFPASTFDSLPTSVRAVGTSGQDSLLAVGDAAHGLQEMGEVFTAETDGVDWDTTAAGGAFTMRTAPVALGDKAVVRRVRVRYEFRIGTATATPKLNVSVNDRDSLSTGQVDVASTGTQWVAVDLATPIEADVVTVTVSLTGARPRDFVVHAVENQYRRFGGL